MVICLFFILQAYDSLKTACCLPLR